MEACWVRGTQYQDVFDTLTLTLNMPCYRHIGRAIQGVRADKPAMKFNFADGTFNVYLDFHPEAIDGERHQYLNADDVFCLEQEEAPLPFVPVEVGGQQGPHTEDTPAHGGGAWAPDMSTWGPDEEGVLVPNPDALGGQAC